MNDEEKDFADYAKEVIRENEKFLKEKARESFGEVIGLVNDAIDYVVFVTKRKDTKEYTTLSMVPFIYHILMPFSYGISIDLLVGNLPACFYELRVMLESLAKCYVADLHPNEDLFFEEKLLSLDAVLKNEEISISKLLKDFGKMVDLNDKPLKIWGKISEEWLHSRIIEKVVDKIIEKSEVPPYGLAIPMNYTEGDLEDIEELGKTTSEFREILRVAMNKYK
ncbi:MAG: hypothetical protein ACP5KW_11725, partial [Thermoproteota archaeon]